MRCATSRRAGAGEEVGAENCMSLPGRGEAVLFVGMARYQGLFDAFGPSALGQVAASTVIGGLIGFFAARKTELSGGLREWHFAVGGAALGLLVGIGLALVDLRRRRVAAGTAKPRGAVFWVVVSCIAAFVFLVACIVFVMH